jgi:tetratricopeptide (TPR) repeat protein
LEEELAELEAGTTDPERFVQLADRAAAAGETDLEVQALIGAVDATPPGGDRGSETAVRLLERAVGRPDASPTPAGVARFRLADLISSSDPDRARQLFSEAVSIFTSGEDFDRAAVALLELAELEGRSQHRESALSCAERARALARRAGNLWRVALADDRIATAEWELGRTDVAERHLRNVLAVWEADGDPAGLALARYRLGWCIASDIRTNERANEALQLLDGARGLARENGDLRLVANCDQRAAEVFHDRDDLERAVSLLRSSVAVLDALGDDEQLATAQVNLGEKLLLHGSAAEGEEVLRSVVESPAAGPAARCGAGHRLARGLATAGRPDEALAVLERVEPLLDDDDRYEAALFELARAEVYLALNMLNPTEKAANRALDHLIGTHLPGLHAEALEFLARCADRQGDRERAEALFGQAVALFLVEGRTERAVRLARDVVPPPPERAEASDADSEPFTGQYL